MSFSVTATGTAPLSYQWQKDGVNLTDGGRITGATTATLTITGVMESDEGGYRCVVTNSAGTATSNTAMLTVGKLNCIMLCTFLLKACVNCSDIHAHAIHHTFWRTKCYTYFLTNQYMILQ